MTHLQCLTLEIQPQQALTEATLVNTLAANIPMIQLALQTNGLMLDGLFLETEADDYYLTVFTSSTHVTQSKLAENPLYRGMTRWLHSIGIVNPNKNVILTSSENNESVQPIPSSVGIDLLKLAFASPTFQLSLEVERY